MISRPVAVEVLKEEKTLQESAEGFQIHPGQISGLKKQLFGNAGTIYDCENTKEKEIEPAGEKQEGLGQARYENE